MLIMPTTWAILPDTDIQRSDDYKQMLAALKERITQAQYRALKAVNRELIKLYWDIGRIIVEKQEQLGWGESMHVIDRLAADLRVAFPGVRGFSARNLRYMRDFYRLYQDYSIWQAMLAKLSRLNARAVRAPLQRLGSWHRRK
jgi:predicted nuclease of restriction endonuclease-like (RecB) superfamily